MGGGRERERLLEGSKLMPAMSTVRLRAVVVGRRRGGEGEEKGRRRGGEGEEYQQPKKLTTIPIP